MYNINASDICINYNDKGGVVMQFKEIRKKKGLTQEELAKQLGIKQSAVAMWETGKSIPNMNHLISLSKLFSMNIEQLAKSFSKERR